MKALHLTGAGLGLIVVIALAAPLLPLADPIQQDVALRLTGPSPDALLGRDELGRDVLSRLVWGARTSLGFAFISVLIAGVLGTLMGMAGAWLRGLGEIVTVRVADIILCFPPLLFAMLVVTLLGPGSATLILVMAVLFLPGFARVAYAETLSACGNDYVEAVRALGAPVPRIMARTLLPNILGPVVVQFSLAICAAIIMEAGLSFLGLGVVPPAPSWGRMLNAARATMDQAPLLLLWPCLALVLTIMAMNAFCDALRDTVDPRAARGNPLRFADRMLPGLLPPARTSGDALLAVEDLSVDIATPDGIVRPVSSVDFSLQPGEVLAIVGESGSGKSLTAAAIMGLLPGNARAAGSIRFAGTELTSLSERALEKLRGRDLAMIFQDPMSSLHPMHRVGEQVAEAILSHRRISTRAARAEALELFRRVGIADPKRRMDAYPHELSGGMRQRVMIAMAIANRPPLLIADEPTTALDTTVQAQIIELIAELRRETGMAMIFISHNLALVSEIADTIAVMYAGEVVEQGRATEILAHPRHPYTQALLAAMPGEGGVGVGIAGTVPQVKDFPRGCRFAPRCPQSAALCTAAPPPLELLGGRQVRCARVGEPARLPEGALT